MARVELRRYFLPHGTLQDHNARLSTSELCELSDVEIHAYLSQGCHLLRTKNRDTRRRAAAGSEGWGLGRGEAHP
jgi:hypothetical protein